jgi:hypothetical protein
LELGLAQVALLCGAAFLAGTVDAIAGGGGLLTVPALLAAGLSPHEALGTNKGQSTFGSFAAWMRFRHAGLVDGRAARISFPVGVAGSIAGAGLALWIRPDALRLVVLALLLVVGVTIGFGKLRPKEDSAERTRPSGAGPPGGGSGALEREARASWAIIAAIALSLGAYDGFFGPGTGTFIIAAYAAFLHLPLERASANAKVLNFASNFAAMLLFARGGAVVWALAAPMAVAQIGGGFLGAHLTVRRGAGLVRGAVLLVVAALVAKIVWDVYLVPRRGSG